MGRKNFPSHFSPCHMQLTVCLWRQPGWVSIIRSTYHKHVIKEKDNPGVSLFFLVRISHIVQGGQHSELSVKACKCLRKKEFKLLVSIQLIKCPFLLQYLLRPSGRDVKNLLVKGKTKQIDTNISCYFRRINLSNIPLNFVWYQFAVFRSTNWSDFGVQTWRVLILFLERVVEKNSGLLTELCGSNRTII